MKQAITKVVSILTQKMLSTVVITLLTVVAVTAVQAFISTYEPPEEDYHVTNRAYVDAAIGAVSGASNVGMPTMISAKSANTGYWGIQANYCSNLNESGYTDWRMPTMDELVYMVSGGVSTSINDAEYLFTRTRADYSNTGSAPNGSWLVLNPSSGGWSWNNYNIYSSVRCIR